MNVLFAAVIIIIAGVTLHGYKRGMVRVVFSLISLILTIGLVFWLTPHVSDFLKTNTPIYSSIREKCIERVQIKTQEEISQETAKQEPLRIAGIEIPKEWQDALQEKAGGAADNILEQSGVYEKIGEYAAGIIVNIIACVISFIFVTVVLQILIHMLDLIAKFPILNSINRLGGILAGAAEGVLIVWILFFVITLCQSSEWGQELLLDIHQNIFLELLYENNAVEDILLHTIM